MTAEKLNQAEGNFRIRGWHVAILFAAIVVVQAISGIVVYSLTSDWAQRGQFGDMFGAVNALFSGLAFAGVIVTILLQREELRLQRLELQQTREELRRSAVAQEASERALRAQAEAAETAARLNAASTLLSYLLEEQRKLESSGVALAMHRDR